MFMLLFALLRTTGGVNNDAGSRCQRLPNFNCFDKLPAVIGGRGARHRRNGNIVTLVAIISFFNAIFDGTSLASISNKLIVLFD